VYRHFAGFELRNALGVDVAKDDFVTEVGEAPGGDEAYPSGSDHADRLSHRPTAGNGCRNTGPSPRPLLTVRRRPSSRSTSAASEAPGGPG
jgi:hypothetical protein